MTLRRRKGPLIVAALVCASAIAVVAVRRTAAGNAPAATPQSVPTPVVVARARVGAIDNSIDLPARVEARSSVVVKSRIDGQIVAIAVREGGRVRAGDVLFRLDPSALAAQQRLAAANLARDRAQLAKSESDLRQLEELARRGFESEAALTAARAGTDVARESVRADEAALDAARVALGYTQVRAPFDGVAGALAVSVGQAVRANDTALLTIVRDSPLYVTAALPESRLADVRAALAAGPVAVDVAVPNGANAPTRVARGTVAFIDNAVDPTSGTIAVKSEVANRDGALVPGQFVSVRLHLRPRERAVSVPAAAVQRGPDGWYVWRIDGATARMQPVEPGALIGGRRVIDAGLAGGETVVVEGQFRLVAGAHVRVQASS